MKSKKLNKKIGEKIFFYRRIKNKTRQSLGEKIGISGQQIKHYESGLTQISVVRLFSISKALQIKFAKFLPKELLNKKRKNSSEL